MGTDVVLSRHGGAGSQVPVTGPGTYSLVPTLATLVILALSHVLVLLLNIGRFYIIRVCIIQYAYYYSMHTSHTSSLRMNY